MEHKSAAIGLLVMACLGSSCGGTGPMEPTPAPESLPAFGAPRTLGDHREIDVRFASVDGAVLSGTVYLPLGSGPFSAGVILPGSAWTVRFTWSEIQPAVVALDAAVFTWDKRGQGSSGGACCPDPGGSGAATMELLADDAVAAVAALRSIREVDPMRVGVLGSSFGAWVAPLAANRAGADVDYVVLTVGGAVSVGQEQLYDQLTGFSECRETGTPPDEILTRLVAAGPSGFDPADSLRALQQPSLWLFGGRDLSHPTELAISILDEIRTSSPKNWTVIVYPDANHSLIQGGEVCQEVGPMVDIFSDIGAWLAGF